ncbi:hypothetical protein HDU79_002877 [Rhizoclosmatium sp. JEL0117]|nr:hypothetical protein HDU79_002877 [Rhizoclosmatium sp. JEL0117]
MGDIDELHGLRKTFHVGAYQQVINDATNPSVRISSDAARIERKVYLYRAYVAQGRLNMATNEITQSDAPELRAVKLLARQLAGVDVSAEAKALLAENPKSALLAVLVASILFNAGLTDDTLTVLHPFKKNLEALALTIQTLLKMNRLDLAKKEVATMKTWADDATLAQMIEAWTNLYPSADEKFNEAFYTFDELAASSTATAKLLTSKAVSKIHAGKFDEAEELLGNALNWNNNDAEALINLIVVAHATGKPAEVAVRLTNQLRDAAPNHIYLQELKLKEDMFDRSAQRFAV